METDTAITARRLGLDEGLLPWLEELREPDPVEGGVPLGGRAGADAALAPFALEPRDHAELVELWPDETWPPQARWLLERMYARIAADAGTQGWRDWPALTEAADARVRCAAVFAFAAATPALRAHHARHGVPAEVSAATLSDVGRHVAKTRVMFGRIGLEVAAWIALHYRHGLYELGRLQYETSRLGPEGAVTWYDPGEQARLPADLGAGSPALRLHIPQSGPLDPAAVQASLERARGFFADCFGADYPVATCTSWLLDPQLARYLPATSNIIAFQRRFELLATPKPGDGDVFRFVFRHPRVAPDEVPYGSRLERAVVDHLRAGGHWQVRTGWLRLP
ncbi:hypothetical protein HDA32_002491 [Spinactinospora alkalitolerans]|uniref:Acyltransferase n=1 Tax=Spinactinospora alkalitolerans TaxID=687207 RepID=A0A852TUM2_9ACTN|nr:acyltransferase domain-containing protein [Spinactinospora alkalitolerans]NYE47371.1 hypothetical protein [Spinactinospora alkalitolerans]